MIWRSIVGKLWITILMLVTAVLGILAILLFQFFENFHLSQVEDELSNHASFIVATIEQGEGQPQSFRSVRQLEHAHGMKVVIFRENIPYWTTDPAVEESNYIPPLFFANHQTFEAVFEGERQVISPIAYEQPGDEQPSEYIVVGAPAYTQNDQFAIFLYNSLDLMDETTAETKRIILLAAGIGLILTTFFAFFLSSRVTAPLRKMRQVTLEVAKGKFDTSVPMLTHDEIGQLAIAFNRMRRQLNNNINALNYEKAQLTRILSSMADGVITLNRRGDMVVTNPPAERFLEAYAYENDENQGLPERLQLLFQKVVTHEEEEWVELSVQGRTYASLMTPLYDEDHVRGVVLVIRDMTEERQHDKLRKDFIANVSHELRTPIAMLQGYSEALLDHVAETEEEKEEMTRIIYDESLRMGRLVNELLDLARMESGNITLIKQDFEVVQLAKKVHQKFQQMAKDADLDLHFNSSEEEAIIYADPDRIEQVLTNLYSNAVRHTESGGSITCSMSSTNETVKIHIMDTGTGIPESDLPFVFERFYKADKARTRGNAGTGLGLAIVKNIIESHGGEIVVQSKEGMGTTFTITLHKALERKD
ncbi:ATP-binding protein [Geomicrobium sp. JCM 19038]|uniref:ATP-binding protein n=1 Tax=Geomicrobium sp. JCM 19038 TaxID=1460635 RepID=UPI00045F2ED2|nr:ATP-binding protein [Geomicrobium sp. JCM 19038]GAK06611.1 sensor histidine kinase ResE [Geomicrobium sp. JCM 19038]